MLPARRTYRFSSAPANSSLRICEKNSTVLWYFNSAVKKQIHWCEAGWACVYINNKLHKKSSHQYNIYLRKLMEEDLWISHKPHSYILKWSMAALHPLQARNHPTHLPFQEQPCWWWYDKSPNRGSSCSRSPGWDHKLLVLTICLWHVSGFRGHFSHFHFILSS